LRCQYLVVFALLRHVRPQYKATAPQTCACSTLACDIGALQTMQLANAWPCHDAPQCAKDGCRRVLILLEKNKDVSDLA
jgi:hypothetical protein